MCSFTVAVNRRKTTNNQDPGADFFNVSAWRALGESCHKYLKKGSKVCVIGPVSVRQFSRSDGSAGASLEVTADDVEFLSFKQENDNQGAAPQSGTPTEIDQASGFQQIAMEQDELPF